MAIEDVAGGMKAYARPFSLVPPPRDRQFRTAALKAERSKRKADRRLASALDEDETIHAVNTAELARLWGSAAYRDLRAGLSPEDEEKLHRQLAGVLGWRYPACGLARDHCLPARGTPRRRSCCGRPTAQMAAVLSRPQRVVNARGPHDSFWKAEWSAAVKDR
jgi:hypothetical protein